MRIKKGDTVLIIKGKDRGKKGKILRAFPREKRVIVEGINLKKKHIRPRKTGEKGEIVTVPGLINVSNVKLICPKCKKATRVGYKAKSETKKQKSKIRICKKCGKEI